MASVVINQVSKKKNGVRMCVTYQWEFMVSEDNTICTCRTLHTNNNIT
jgi:hypothetical protein